MQPSSHGDEQYLHVSSHNGHRTSLRPNRNVLLHEILHFFDDPNDHDRGRIIILCAEPYMDAAGIISGVTRKAKDCNVSSSYVDFHGSQLVDPIIELSRTVRGVIDHNPSAVVCFNGLPSVDDDDVPRVVRPLLTLACHNCLVLISLYPEDMYIIDAVHGCRIYRSHDMIAMGWPSSTTRDKKVFDITHGIPSLVSCCNAFPDTSPESLEQHIEYLSAVGYCVRTFLRESLMNEERKVRCAAALLGSGTYDEIVELTGSKSIELLDQSAIDSPFFGIDVDKKQFTCAGIRSVGGLNAAYRFISDVCQLYPELPIEASKILLRRGDTERAAVVCLMARDAAERRCLVITFAWGFFNAGEFGLLRNALDDTPIAAYNDPESIENARKLVDSIDPDASSALQDSVAKDCENSLPIGDAVLPGTLALRFREILSGQNLDRSIDITCEDHPRLQEVSRFVEAVRLGINGELRESYSLLLECMPTPTRDVPCVFSGVLSVVYIVVASLVGVSMSPAEQRWFLHSRDYFERLGLEFGKAACDASVELTALIAGNSIDTERIDSLSRKAERSGLHVIHAFCRMAQAVMDLRAGAAMRACVRLKGLVKESGSAGLPLLASQAAILLLAATACMGDRTSAEDTGANVSGAPELAPINDIVRRIVCEEDSAASVLKASSYSKLGTTNLGGSLPIHSVWLVDVLAKDCGEFSHAFQDVLPNSWRRTLRQFSSIRMPEHEAVELNDSVVDGARAVPLLDGPEGLRVEIFLLGRFMVKINGREMDPRTLERRRSKSLLSLLALVPGHTLKRYAIIESVWPELDYESGVHRVYEATSVLRQKLVGPDGAKIPRPLLSNRMEHSMTLNPECVWVDVDHFSGLVRRILDSEGNDRLVVGLCRQAEGFYRGDLVIPPNDGLGVANKRREQLRGMFADAMVAGSTAAARLGLRLTAARFARKAYTANNEREDAIICLVRSLVATGRNLEAEREYREYSLRVVEKGHRPPSRDLRKLIEELLEPGGEAPNGEQRGQSGSR